VNSKQNKGMLDIGFSVVVFVSLGVMFFGPLTSGQPKNVSDIHVRRIKAPKNKQQINKTVQDTGSTKGISSSNPNNQKAPLTTFSPNASMIPYGVQTMPSSVNPTIVKSPSRIPTGPNKVASRHSLANPRQQQRPASIKSSGRSGGSSVINALLGMRALAERRKRGE
jgi:hypothetical protein